MIMNMWLISNTMNLRTYVAVSLRFDSSEHVTQFEAKEQRYAVILRITVLVFLSLYNTCKAITI